MESEVEILLVEDNPNDAESDVVESYRLGVNSYIVKPVDFDKFIESVKDIGLYWLLLNQQPDISNMVR